MISSTSSSAVASSWPVHLIQMWSGMETYQTFRVGGHCSAGIKRYLLFRVFSLKHERQNSQLLLCLSVHLSLIWGLINYHFVLLFLCHSSEGGTLCPLSALMLTNWTVHTGHAMFHNLLQFQHLVYFNLQENTLIIHHNQTEMIY